MKNSIQCIWKVGTHTHTHEKCTLKFTDRISSHLSEVRVILRLILLFTFRMTDGMRKKVVITFAAYNHRNDHIVCRNGIKINAKYFVLRSRACVYIPACAQVMEHDDGGRKSTCMKLQLIFKHTKSYYTHTLSMHSSCIEKMFSVKRAISP